MHPSRNTMGEESDGVSIHLCHQAVTFTPELWASRETKNMIEFL